MALGLSNRCADGIMKKDKWNYEQKESVSYGS